MKDHKLMYGVYIRAGMFSSIIIVILLFLFIPYAEPEPFTLKTDIVTMVEEISAMIEKVEEPPPEERPKVAVEAESEIAEEAVETIAATEFEEDLIRTTPIGPDIEIVPYYKVEVKPKPIFIPKPHYPDLARQAGIEGKTVVKALVDIDGSIIDAKILKSSGNQMLDQAALATAREAQFTPAKQRDKFVRVWVAIPVTFILTGGS
ncbi:MAG: energy transducer TonB [candidate division WOR-3 bacterium]|nr:MAG: energy transducer TonB [candidate division WOR-3 bacterium]